MSKVFTGDDQVVEAGANRSFLLDTGGVWFVERGRVDVFCMRLAAGGRVAARTHVARVPAGGCLFGDGRGDVDEGGPAAGVGRANGCGAVPSGAGEAAVREDATDSPPGRELVTM